MEAERKERERLVMEENKKMTDSILMLARERDRKLAERGIFTPEQVLLTFSLFIHTFLLSLHLTCRSWPSWKLTNSGFWTRLIKTGRFLLRRLRCLKWKILKRAWIKMWR